LLNPALPLRGRLWGLIATIWAGYATSALFYADRHATTVVGRRRRPGGSSGCQALASATVLAAALMWLNLRGLRRA
jgi:hypothetical protein